MQEALLIHDTPFLFTPERRTAAPVGPERLRYFYLRFLRKSGMVICTLRLFRGTKFWYSGSFA